MIDLPRSAERGLGAAGGHVAASCAGRHSRTLGGQLAAANRPEGGIPIPEGLEGVDAFTELMHQILRHTWD
jgi:hypothetical protein